MMADHASGIGICVSKVLIIPLGLCDREMVNPPRIIEMGRRGQEVQTQS